MISKTKQSPSKCRTLLKEVRSHIEELARETDKARFSAEMTAYLDSCARFHRYSPQNTWLIRLACPGATQVAGYHRWKQLGRYVKKGEKGIPILAPLKYKLDKDDPDSPEEVYGFRVVYVFDVSQTDGDPLPEEPEWRSLEVDEDLQARLLSFAEKRGIEVEFSDDLGEVQGVSKGGIIILAKTAGTKTLIHELAHELMHRDPEQPATPKPMRELEAEAVAYVVAKHFGLHGLASPNYIALHGATSETISSHLDRIVFEASSIIAALGRDVGSK